MTDLQNEQIDARLRRIEKMVEENNVHISKMYRAVVWGRVARIIYWVIILGAAVGAFYFVQPYFESLLGSYEQVQGSFDQVRSVINGFGSDTTATTTQ